MAMPMTDQTSSKGRMATEILIADRRTALLRRQVRLTPQVLIRQELIYDWSHVRWVLDLGRLKII
jgi:hypothetical protein